MDPQLEDAKTEKSFCNWSRASFFPEWLLDRAEV